MRSFHRGPTVSTFRGQNITAPDPSHHSGFSCNPGRTIRKGPFQSGQKIMPFRPRVQTKNRAPADHVEIVDYHD